MIIENAPLQVSQSRNIIRDPMNPQSVADGWGRAPAMVPSKVVRCSLYVDVCYTEEHAHLIRDLVVAAQKIGEALPVNPFKCEHRSWDFIDKCQNVCCLTCGNVAPLSDKHKQHLPFAECSDKTCPQCDRGE